jgi:DNA-directed RNA polymerase specialized sigma24 family protein
VHAYALRRSDATTADEVVADTFLVCWRRFDRVPDTRARAALEALALLPPKEREALQLCAWEGLSPWDAARVAGCTAGAFRVRLHRARRKLEAAVGVRAASGLETGQEVA